MDVWASPYTCTDCGREVPEPGTCWKCKAENQPEQSPRPAK
jgi:DNA-directed RNA polymerase subunit RPC12/RpoP